MTLNRAASSGQRSVSTLSTTARPAISDAVFFTSGAAMRHGPHHAAQKSINTGTVEPDTISSKTSTSASIGSASGGRGALHEPQFPSCAMCLAGILFFCPHALQFRIIVSNFIEGTAHVTFVAPDYCPHHNPEHSVVLLFGVLMENTLDTQFEMRNSSLLSFCL